MDDNEFWMDIPQYEGRYRISNFGRIESCERNVMNNGTSQTIPQKILKQILDTNGYLYVNLCKGIPKKFYVHKLMVTTFVRPLTSEECCRHLNGIKMDNRIDNLALGTRFENSEDDKKNRNSPYGKKGARIILNEDDVRNIRTDHKDNGKSLPNLAKQYRIGLESVRRIVDRETWKFVD